MNIFRRTVGDPGFPEAPDLVSGPQPAPPLIPGGGRAPAADRAESGGRDPILRKIIDYGLIGLLVFSPLPAASTRNWAILIIEIVAIVLAAAYLLQEHRPHLHPELAAKGRIFLIFLAVLSACVAVQLVPWPTALVRLISPNSLILRARYNPSFGSPSFLPFSLVPAETAREALEVLSYLILTVLVVLTVTHHRQIQRLFIVLIALGTFEAFYGLFECFRSNPRILFYPKVFHPESASGTFVNRNHFSGYLEMIIPLAIAFLLSRISLFNMSGKRWRARLAMITSKGTTVSLFIVLSILVMSLAVLRSHSRSGMFILALTFVLFIELAVYTFGMMKARERWVRWFLIGLVAFITLTALYMGVETTVSRFSVDNLLQEGRPKYWANVLSMFGDFPLTGTGLGTFPSVFSAYESAGLEGPLVHAHNDYLEALSELGIFGFAVVLAGIAFLLWTVWRVWTKRKNPEVKGLALGPLIAVAAMLFHSLTDFNLHIPANRVLFAVVLGLAFCLPYYRKTVRHD